jgi:DNA-binding LacI/PurR family transcriptional regulator
VDTPLALRLKQAAGPVILADWRTEDPVLHTVTFDDDQVGRLIAEHLLGLGHRYALWMDAADLSPARTARWRAADRVFRAAGARMRFVGRPEYRSYAACRDFLIAEDRPTAIVAGGFAACLEVMTVAGHLGFEVPRQLSLVATSDPVSNVGAREFTGIDYHPAEMGRRAFELMLRVKPGDDVRAETVPVELIDRGTTAPSG